MTNPLDDLLKRYEQELIAIQNRKAQAKRSYELECQNEHRYQGAIIGVKAVSYTHLTLPTKA